MTLWPRSLFGRLVATLVTGLLAAQVLGTVIQFHDRGQILYQASGLQAAARIAEITHLLESFAPEQRARLAAALDRPPMRVSLTQPTWPGDPQAVTEDTVTTLFRAALRRSLGADHPFRVVVTDVAPLPAGHGPPGAGRGMGMGRHHRMGGMAMGGMGMGFAAARGLSFLAQVQLHDGTWVTYDHRVPEEIFTWPQRLLLTLVVMVGAVIALSILAVRGLTRPLTLLARAAEALGRDIHHPPLAESGPTEVRRAARAFNTMQGRLVRFLEDRARILSAVSHDLKTPITRLRLRAELVKDPELQASLLNDLEEMQAMTGATLDFLRGVNNKEPVQPVDIGDLLESLQEDARAVGREVRITGQPVRPYPSHPLALKRCLSNLLDNALKFGRRPQISVDDSDDELEIIVADDGPGIPEQALERVFEPFYRLEGSRNRATGGTGLGLSIARNIARAHGGELILRNRPAGGLEAVLRLPR